MHTFFAAKLASEEHQHILRTECNEHLKAIAKCPLARVLRRALLLRNCSKERATASGVAQLFWNLPNSFGEPAGGYMIDGVWVDAPSFSTAVFYAVYTAAFWLMFRSVEDQHSGWAGSGGLLRSFGL